MKKKKLRCTRCGNEFYSDNSEGICNKCGGLALLIEEPWEILFSYFSTSKKITNETKVKDKTK